MNASATAASTKKISDTCNARRGGAGTGLDCGLGGAGRLDGAGGFGTYGETMPKRNFPGASRGFELHSSNLIDVMEDELLFLLFAQTPMVPGMSTTVQQNCNNDILPQFVRKNQKWVLCLNLK